MASAEFQKLLELMARLRAPDGCPWDREQSLESLKPYLLEEAYEVLDAMERGDWEHLPEELGDLQLQIVFQAQIASEQGLFEAADVLRRINEKLIRRHPHVFGGESAKTAGQVLERWDKIKAEEKQEKQQRAAARGDAGDAGSVLDGVPRSQPALMEARELGKRASKEGFDWPALDDVTGKLHEEIEELERALLSRDAVGVEDELGDLLFTLVNVARHVGVNPELALRKTNRKFRERFAYVERELGARGRPPGEASLEEMEQLWQQAKKR